MLWVHQLIGVAAKIAQLYFTKGPSEIKPSPQRLALRVDLRAQIHVPLKL